MARIHNFKDTLKPMGISLIGFALTSTLFVITYIFLDYQLYARNFQRHQAQEITIAHQKTEAILDQLGKLLSLLDSRIGHAGENPKRIQWVLNSVHQSAKDFPEFQRVAFYKLSLPKMIVTRFGELPPEVDKFPKEENLPKDGNPLFRAEHQSIIGRKVGIGADGLTGSVLEIRIAADEFWKNLGAYETIHFVQLSNSHHQKVASLFQIQEMAPQSFWAYGLAHRSIYVGIGFYMVFSIILLGLCLYSLRAYFQRSYGRKALSLEKGLHESQSMEKSLREELWTYQQEAQTHQSSCQLHRKLQANIKLKQQNYLGYLAQSLEILRQSLAHSQSAFTEHDRIDLVDLCLRQVKPLSQGIWEPRDREEVSLGDILQNIPLLFAEKIHTSHIKLVIDIPSDTASILQSEDVFMELLLINVIGKSLYRVPKEGNVIVSLGKQENSYHLEIRDNGYILTGAKASLMKNTFEFSMEDATFQQLCRDNHIVYKISKGNGMNVTHLILPISPMSYEAADNSNVVPLFK